MPRTSSGVTSVLLTVSTIRPWYMTLIRSDRSNTSWMSWLIEEDADALVLELADEVADLGGLGRAEGRGRLVHDQDPGVEVDGPGDGHRLALAARQGLDRHREAREVRVQPPHDLARLGLHARVVEACRTRVVSSRPRNRFARRIDVVGQGERLVDRLDVERLGVARVADRRPARRRRGSRRSRPGGRRTATRISVDLPAPLPPTRPMTSPGMEVDGHVAHGVHAAERDVDVRASRRAACAPRRSRHRLRAAQASRAGG